MLRKLIKYDMKYIGRIMIWIYLIALALSVLASALFFGVLKSTVFLFVFVPIILLLLLSVAAVGVSGHIMMAVRIYKNMYSDEGYLTFTLPATAHQHIWSKIITGVIWELLGMLAALICILMPTAVVLALSPDIIDIKTIWDALGFALREIMKSDIAPVFVANAVLSAAYTVLSLLAAPLQMLFSFSIGQFAKRLRVLTAVAVYYAFNMVISMLTAIVSFVMMMPTVLGSSATVSPTDPVAEFMSTITWHNFTITGINMCILLVVYVICYAATHHIMTNKLNLV